MINKIQIEIPNGGEILATQRINATPPLQHTAAPTIVELIPLEMIPPDAHRSNGRIPYETSKTKSKMMQHNTTLQHNHCNIL